jgi:DNA-directed RNA polymerase subunit M/transcription elongation factor TFIIS
MVKFTLSKEFISDVKTKHPNKYKLLLRRCIKNKSLDLALALDEDSSLYRHKENKEIVADGDIQCFKCKSKKVKKIEKQTRSADESATIFAFCTVCGNRWKI